MWVTKLLISPVKKRIFCPRTTKFGPKLAFLPGLAGLFGALLVDSLVVVARRLYLARHLFTLCSYMSFQYFTNVQQKCLKCDKAPLSSQFVFTFRN